MAEEEDLKRRYLASCHKELTREDLNIYRLKYIILAPGSKLKILVTGGAGFIGSHLVERLIREKNEVLILDDFSAGTEQNLEGLRGTGVHIVKGSVVNQEIVDYCMKDVDLAYHLAAKTNVDESLDFPHMFNDINASGTLNVLTAAKERGVPVVHMSTSEVYGSPLYVPMDENHPLNPQSPYAASKVAAEKYCYAFHSSYGSKVVILRSFNNYGPRQKGNVSYGGLIARNIIRTLLGQRPVIRGGSQKRDYMYVKDTVDALQVIGTGTNLWGETLNVGTGKSLTATETVEMILKVCGSNLRPIHGKARPGDVMNLECDSKKAKEEIAWRPHYSFEKGLRETVAWYKSNIERFKGYIFPSFKQLI